MTTTKDSITTIDEIHTSLEILATNDSAGAHLENGRGARPCADASTIEIVIRLGQVRRPVSAASSSVIEDVAKADDITSVRGILLRVTIRITGKGDKRIHREELCCLGIVVPVDEVDESIGIRISSPETERRAEGSRCCSIRPVARRPLLPTGRTHYIPHSLVVRQEIRCDGVCYLDLLDRRSLIRAIKVIVGAVLE